MKKLFALLIPAMMMIALVIPVQANGANYIANGDFELGNQGFFSEYTYQVEIPTQNDELWQEWEYGVGVDPYAYHYLWKSYGDHTSGVGNMMIVNAKPNEPPMTVWEQSVTLPQKMGAKTESHILYAGQSWAIGEVLTKFENGKVFVKFVITDPDAIAEGWGITQAHVAAATSCSNIPHTKSGSPIPGKFPVNQSFTPTTETEWFDLGTFGENLDLCIAAHAKIELPEISHIETTTHNFCAISGVDTDLANGLPASISSVDPWGNLDTNVSSEFVDPTIASYMWDADVATSYYADNGGMVSFVHNFNILGTPKTATLKIAADNAFAFSLNYGTETHENLVAGWRDLALMGDFGYPYMVIDPLSTGWADVYSYNVVGSLVSGENRLDITGVNADWDTTLWSVNPAAVIYKLCGTSETYQKIIDRPYRSETGWGDGNEADGNNWAMYMNFRTTYIPVEANYEFSLWAANSHTDNPAVLDIQFDSDSIGGMQLSTIDPLVGTWKQFKYSFSSMGGNFVIKIVDTFTIAQGDDFALDDIKLIEAP